MSEKYPTTIDDIQKEQWVILQNRSIHIPGDERSRTNPGHGYPAHDEKFIGMETYDDEKELKDRIIQLKDKRADFKVVKMIPCQVTTTVEVDISV